ncbi:MAG: CCA-adding enzyme [Marine Group III euryarchaeote CG-Epi6]|uniref:CCA-adding enzyme n=1 Tax=Marine Group III euryarchaeote CG-Epi6 TaxID=1889000 RepID=A0A1J5TCQ8_9ARCH|nr:MAG: CCA-adding enzyme [Marine Group III euryarchaeote CG-Epi6]
MKELIKEALKQVEPKLEEKEKLLNLKDRILNKIEQLGIKGVEPKVVGSIAKGTYLEGTDIDIFLVFQKGTNLKEEGLDIAKKILPKGKELYAQHPYLRGEIKGVGIDLVPCFAIDKSTESVSAVDRTPFHTDWVVSNIAGLENEVRLTKQFLKAIGAYGANSAIGGFSGYLVEILCIKYGGFLNLINEISQWRPPITIDEIRNAPDSPIMICDPVDHKRNVAAGVTLKGLGTAILASKSFIDKPSMNFFYPEYKERKFQGKLTTIVLPLPKGNEETIMPWLQKQGRKIYRALSDFEPIAWNANMGQEGYIVIETGIRNLPEIISHKGPAPWENGAIEFLKKYPNATLNNERLEIGKKPKKRTIGKVVNALLPEAKIVKGLVESAKPIQRVPWLD